ncbi:MAG: NUDIX hydrolase [Erysipelotrichaceae bacterium]|nr:NUDIX hydrolase [Erysipelotrichaceae bacterium]
MKLINDIERYKPYNQQEEADREIILNFLRNHEDIFLRENLVAHMTASSWVVNKTHDKILMAYHNLYDSWAWLGGHADGERELLKVALKEVREETSIKEVRPLSEEIFSLEILSVDGHFKRGQYVPTHLHLNVTYLLEADDSQFIHNKEDENSAVGWLTPEEMMKKVSEPWFRDNIYSKLNQKLKLFDLKNEG